MLCDDQKRKAIKALVVKAYGRCGQLSRESQMTILIDDLMALDIEIQSLHRCFEVNAQNSSYAPVLADILRPLRDHEESQFEAHVEAMWKYFIGNAFRPTAKIEDWAYDIRKSIGESRVFYAQPSDVTWIKKEFSDLAKRQLLGELKISGDPRDWQRIGNSWALPSASKIGPEKINFDLQLKEIS